MTQKVQTSAPRGRLRDRIVKGPINSQVISIGSRKFIRQGLMKQVKTERRIAGLRRTNKQVPIGPRPTLMFRRRWRTLRGMEQEDE